MLLLRVLLASYFIFGVMSYISFDKLNPGAAYGRTGFFMNDYCFSTSN